MQHCQSICPWWVSDTSGQWFTVSLLWGNSKSTKRWLLSDCQSHWVPIWEFLVPAGIFLLLQGTASSRTQFLFTCSSGTWVFLRYWPTPVSFAVGCIPGPGFTYFPWNTYASQINIRILTNMINVELTHTIIRTSCRIAANERAQMQDQKSN
jgi:hypothetical protein